jgi:hypothetical protein
LKFLLFCFFFFLVFWFFFGFAFGFFFSCLLECVGARSAASAQNQFEAQNGEGLHKMDQKVPGRPRRVLSETSSPRFVFSFLAGISHNLFLVFFHRFSCVTIALRASSDWCSAFFFWTVGGVGAEQMSIGLTLGIFLWCLYSRRLSRTVSLLDTT